MAKRKDEDRNHTAPEMTDLGAAVATIGDDSGADLINAPARRFSFAVMAICGLLVLAIALVFGQTLRHDFVNYDDNWCVYENPIVTGGLTEGGIRWSFTATDGSMWGPVTWMSHMLDCQIYGLKPWGHHLTNILLHVITSIALFLTLRRMTGNLWPSALAAAIFAVHPLHVESVAWVAERKGLLGGLFFVLTLGAYVRYIQRPFSKGNYLAILLFFILGLMSKPVAVTLPFVLLLLDFWPLKRLGYFATEATAADSEENTDRTILARFRSFPWRVLVEKIPLFALSAVSCAVAPLTQSHAVAALDIVPLSTRIANAAVSYVTYLGQFFYPSGLAVFYPHPSDSLPAWKVTGALAILLVISVAAVIGRRRLPYLFVGWFWFLGTLVPMIGLVQVGSHAMADRYTYVTQIGLYIAVVWGIADVVSSWRYRRWVCGIAGTLAVLVLAGCAWQQASYWRDSETLWARNMSCTPTNPITLCNFAQSLRQSGKDDEALAICEGALKIFPDNAEIQNNMGDLLTRKKQPEKAISHLKKALQIKPVHAGAHYNLGIALMDLKKTDEALVQFQKAVEDKPNYLKAHNNIACILAESGRTNEAIIEFQKILDMNPGDVNARDNLGKVLYGKGYFADAVGQWRMAVQMNPNHIGLVNQLAWAMATCPDESVRNAKDAVFLAQWAMQLSQEQDPTVLATLAAACAESGQFPEAIASAEKAIALASALKFAVQAEAIRAQLKCYKAGTPFREKIDQAPKEK